MGRHDLVAIKADPYHGHLGTAVWVQGHQVSQGRGVEHRSGAVGQRRRHGGTLAVQIAKARPGEVSRSSPGRPQTMTASPVHPVPRWLRFHASRMRGTVWRFLVAPADHGYAPSCVTWGFEHSPWSEATNTAALTFLLTPASAAHYPGRQLGASRLAAREDERRTREGATGGGQRRQPPGGGLHAPPGGTGRRRAAGASDRRPCTPSCCRRPRWTPSTPCATPNSTSGPPAPGALRSATRTGTKRPGSRDFAYSPSPSA